MWWFIGLCVLCLWAPRVAAEPTAGYLPGRPWTAIVPDPDSFDWSATDRPGYRFRGMEPMQQRFYDYLLAKRAAGQAPSSVDQMMVRRLIAARRWPEPPRPNEFWAAYMRWLREQTSDELNTAQNLLLTELMRRGLVAHDQAPSETIRRLLDLLQSQPVERQNWFERNILSVEQVMDYTLASQGVPMAPPAGAVYSEGPFRGLSLEYRLSGLGLAGPGEAVDRPDGAARARRLRGTFAPPCTVVISGRATVEGQAATLRVSIGGVDITLGRHQQEAMIWPEQGGRADFQVTTELPAHCDQAHFTIVLDRGHGPEGWGGELRVEGSLSPAAPGDPAPAADDEPWRRTVAETVARLGDTGTPLGRELAAMREALRGGDADWRRYVDEQQRKLSQGPEPTAEPLRQLWQAAEQGGPAWDDHLRRSLGVQAPSAPADAAGVGDDQGGTIEVGTELVDGRLIGVAGTFVQPLQLSCRLDFVDLPQGTQVVAVWHRDGRELARSAREASGTGWVSFTVMGGDGGPLPPGRYRLVVSAGERQLGWRDFTVQ